MERKLGEIFTYKGKTYQAVEVEVDEECKGCAFEFSSCCTSSLGDCSPTHRTDGASVIFKEINNMENNQLTINIPEGMEIDLENSDLAKGIIKFKQSTITYEDILQAYTIEYGSLVVSSCNIDKLLAVSKLMDIAKYYNGDWKPDWSNSNEFKFYIVFDYFDDMYKTKSKSETCNNIIYFTHREDAQSVIDNPNFRDILDAIYKN